MKILITGCKGQLGRELMRQLRDKQSELGQLPGIYRKVDIIGVDIDDFDLSKKEEVWRCFRETMPDIIVNTAAYTNVDGCETDPDAAFSANGLAVRNLAEVANQSTTKLCHISTDYVFSGDADQPYREYDLPNPKSVYGKTKLSGEQYAAARCRRLFVVRTQWLYGYYGNNFVKTILRLAREKGHLSVVNDQFGCPTNAVDLAHHILKISAGNCYGVYHCANHGVASWYEFAQEIVRLSGIKASVTPCTTEEFPRPAPRPAYSPLDNMMLRLTVQDTMRSWQDALAVFMQNLEREMSKETK